MAQPPRYERTHDFTNDEPSELDTDALNSELDNASESINKIRDNLALIQRDDGKLQSKSVGIDQIDDELKNDLSNSAKKYAEDALNYARISEKSAEDAKNAADNASTSETNSEKYSNVAKEYVTGFDAHVVEKQNGFDSHAADRQTQFDNHAAEKTTEYDTHAATKTTEFNQNAQEKQQKVDEVAEKVEEYSWDIPHVVENLEQVEQYQHDGYFWVKGYGQSQPGEDISNRVVNGKELGKYLQGYVTPEMFGAKGNANHYNVDDGRYYVNATYTNQATAYNEADGKYYSDNTYTTIAKYYNVNDEKWYVNAYFSTLADDDTDAIDKAISSGSKVVFGYRKSYLISLTLNITTPKTIDFNFSRLCSSENIDALVNINISHGDIIDGVGGKYENLFLDCYAKIGLLVSNAFQAIISNIRFTNVQNTAFKYLSGWENQFKNFYIFGSTPFDAVGIDVYGGDSDFINMRGYDIKQFIIARSINVYTDIHAWMRSKPLLNGSKFITLAGGEQRINNAYSDTYEYAFYYTTLVASTFINSYVLIDKDLYNLQSAYVCYFNNYDAERFVSIIGGTIQGIHDSPSILKLRNTENDKHINITNVYFDSCDSYNGNDSSVKTHNLPVVSSLISNNKSTTKEKDGIVYVDLSFDVDLTNQTQGALVTLFNSSLLLNYNRPAIVSLQWSEYGDFATNAYMYLGYSVQIKVPSTRDKFHCEYKTSYIK